VNTHAEVDVPSSWLSEHRSISLSLAVASMGGFVVRTDVGFDFGNSASFGCALSLNDEKFAQQLTSNCHCISVKEVQWKNVLSHGSVILPLRQGCSAQLAAGPQMR
jgi:hypothetical protein